MKELIENSALFYYTDVLLVIVSFFSTIVIYYFNNSDSTLKHLYLYPLTSTINSLFNYYILYFSGTFVIENKNLFIITSNTFFTLFEFIALSYFLILLTNSFRSKKISLLFQLAYIIFAVIGVQIINTNNLVEYLYILNSAFLAPISFICLLDNIITNTEKSLVKLSGFWLTSGVNIYFIGTIPIFLSTQIIFHDSFYISEVKIYSINYIAYSILFIFLAITKKCNTQEQQ